MGWPGAMTHRQFLVWQAWTEAEWDRPSRSDHYLMRLTAAVLKVKRIVWKDLFIPFGGQEGDGKPTVTRETAAEESKARWAVRRAIGLRNQRAMNGG